MPLAKLVLIIPFLVVQAPTAQPVPEKIADFLEHCETSRRGAILQAEHRLRGLQRQPATAETARDIRQLEQQLRTLKDDKTLIVPPLSFPLQKGAIGRLQNQPCQVEQVVSGQELLVRCFFRVPVMTVRDRQRYREMVTQSVPLLVRNFDSKSFTEGQNAEIPGVFEVLGVERYETVSGGFKDITVLAPFSLANLGKYRTQNSP